MEPCPSSISCLGDSSMQQREIQRHMFFFASTTLSILAAKSLLFSEGITHPFTFQGLRSFFLVRLLQLHERYFQHILVPLFCVQVSVTTIWQTPWAAHCNKA
jgi:hypothetical protein